MRFNRLFIVVAAFLFASCSVAVRTSSDNVREAPEKEDVVELSFLQMNDVYEIAALENGKSGGMARVATVRNELLKENPNTVTVVSGDFISPSAVGTSSVHGKRINGAHMVDAMNAVGVDYVCFGNHEFDLGYGPLQDRINQSTFAWISSNIRYTPSQGGSAAPFRKIVDGKEEPFPESKILTFTNGAGAALRVGLIGVAIGTNRPPYIVFEDPFDAARRVVNTLKGKTDIIVAMTHLSIEEDRKLASLVPEINLILGGHEHTNMLFKFGETLVAKADANVRTVYIHRLAWSTAKKILRISSEVKTIDATIPEEPITLTIVNDWMVRAYAGFQENGFTPNEVVTRLKEPLDGRESSIRFKQTNLGTTICNSMIAAAKKAKVALFNSGSVRLDDQLIGVITEYDIIRTLPYGGKIIEVEMKAGLLQKAIEAGMGRAGAGAFPQFAGILYDSGKKQLLLEGKALDTNAKLWVIVADYLFSGKENGVEFFKRDHPDVSSVDEPADATDLRRDIRLAMIEYLKNNNE